MTGPERRTGASHRTAPQRLPAGGNGEPDGPNEPNGSNPGDVNFKFYESLWSDAFLIRPERFNTWPLMRGLADVCPRRLEVGPGLRPRLPLEGTAFLDLSDSAVAKLRKAGASAATGVVSALPFDDEAFDLVCACDVIEHVEADGPALAEVARVTAPGATLIVSVPLHPDRWTPFDDFVGHFHRYRPEVFFSGLERLGFRIRQSAGYGMQPKSSWLLDMGMRMLTTKKARAMWWYNRVFMPFSLRFQEKLKLTDGILDPEGLDQIFLVCRKNGVENPQRPSV